MIHANNNKKKLHKSHANPEQFDAQDCSSLSVIISYYHHNEEDTIVLNAE